MRMYVEVEHQVVSIVSYLLELCHCHEKNIAHCIVHLYCMLLFPDRRLHATKTMHQKHIHSLRACLVHFSDPNLARN